MATAKIDTVIRHLRRAVLRQVAEGKTDGQLLASFIEQKDEAAFEALVRRHGPMVFGVCRRVVGNHHDAEDAFQATFLVLARKASSVKPRERFANWLHGVALRTAMKAKATTAKRRKREKQVTEMPEPEAVQQDQWRDLQPLLDQELNGLPENYRLPILFCDLEGKTIKEAAQQLGWPQGTLAGRLARGRKLLAKRLANRGVALSAGSLAVIVSQNVASAGVPTSLMSSTIKAATMIAAGQAATTGVISVKVAALTEGVLKTMLLTKLKTVVAVPLVMALALGGGAGLLYQTQAAEQSKQDRPKAEQGSKGTEAKKTIPKPRLNASGRMYEFWCDLIEVQNGCENRVAAPTLRAVEGKQAKWSLPGVIANPERQHLLSAAVALSASAKKLDDGRLRLTVRFERLGQLEVENENELRVKGTSLLLVKTIKPREQVSLELGNKRLQLTVVQVNN